MTYSPSYYYYPLSLFLWVSSWTCFATTGTNCFVADAGPRADTITHQLHTTAADEIPLLTMLVSHQRNHTSNLQHTKQMTITNPAKQINTRADWHRWFDERRARLTLRLRQAEEAEWNWPCTRRRLEIMRIEDEIEALNEEEFVVPF